jgi:hypothetical protein
VTVIVADLVRLVAVGRRRPVAAPVIILPVRMIAGTATATMIVTADAIAIDPGALIHG